MAPKKNKKNQCHNAFYYFMVERQAQMERNGKHFAGGMRDVANAVSHEWDMMNAVQRAKYEDFAMREKGRHGERYTTQGETYDEVDRKDRAKKEREEKKLSSIKEFLVGQGRNTGLATASFFFIHINYYCQKETAFYPAEISLARYTIKGGIDQANVYHRFISFGHLPLGLAHKANQRASETHGIPLPPLPKDLAPVTSEEKLYSDLLAFVQDYLEDGSLPPFYTREKLVPSVESMLKQLALDNGNNYPDYFRVFPLEQLFFDMKVFSLKPPTERLVVNGKTDDGFPFKSFSDNILEEDRYSYKLRIACEFHEEADRVQHCSRSFVIRWGWHFSNNMCANMDINMMLDYHCPRDTDLSASTVIAQQQPDAVVPVNQSWNQVPARNPGSSRMLPSTGAICRGEGRAAGGAAPSHPPALPRASTSEQLSQPNAWGAKPKDDYQPLRKPTTTSKAMSLAVAGSSGLSGGAHFSAADFPAIGGGPGVNMGHNGRVGGPISFGRGRSMRPASAPGPASPARSDEELRRQMHAMLVDEYASPDDNKQAPPDDDKFED